MKQFAEITYDKIDENADYDELINKYGLKVKK